MWVLKFLEIDNHGSQTFLNLFLVWYSQDLKDIFLLILKWSFTNNKFNKSYFRIQNATSSLKIGYVRSELSKYGIYDQNFDFPFH